MPVDRRGIRSIDRQANRPSNGIRQSNKEGSFNKRTRCALSMKTNWQTGVPPNEVPVEVEFQDKIIIVKAFHGRDGTRPHWREDAGSCYESYTFKRWRRIN
jgi:hypothetical protein